MNNEYNCPPRCPTCGACHRPPCLSELSLQLFLAKELPELLEVPIDKQEKKANPWPRWKETGIYVNPREWDWIVREVEKRLTDEQRGRYIWLLTLGAHKPTTSSILVLRASWQTRAIALAKTLGKEIPQ